MRSFFILGSSSPSRKKLLRSIGYIPNLILHPEIDETPIFREKPLDLAKRLGYEKARRIKDILLQQKNLQSLCVKLQHDNYHQVIILSADTVTAVGRRILPKATTKDEALQCLDILSGKKHRVYTGVSILYATTTDILKFYNNYNIYCENNNLENHDLSKYFDIENEPILEDHVIDSNVDLNDIYSNTITDLDLSDSKNLLNNISSSDINPNIDNNNIDNNTMNEEVFYTIQRMSRSAIKFKRLSDIEKMRYIESNQWLDKSGGYDINGYAASFAISIAGDGNSSLLGLPSYKTRSLLEGIGFYSNTRITDEQDR